MKPVRLRDEIVEAISAKLYREQPRIFYQIKPYLPMIADAAIDALAREVAAGSVRGDYPDGVLKAVAAIMDPNATTEAG